MQTTTNLGLKLLGTSVADKATDFMAWRQDVSGETGSDGGKSNMQKIDEAFDPIPLSEINDLIDEIFGVTYSGQK